MAKSTFYNLKADKKNKLVSVLKRLFQEKPLQEVTVKEIVDELNIARGSFYQYFEDLEDAYFTILNEETTDIHALFINLLQKDSGELEKALKDYGDMLSEILFKDEVYSIYKNRFLYWNESLDRRWKEEYKDHDQIFMDSKTRNFKDIEKMHYLKGVVHMLIKRNFQEHWSQKEFKERYALHVHWTMKGVR